MTRPGPVDLARLRRRPHRTTLYMGIYQPQVALACQINGAISKGAITIPYDNVTEGSPDLVEEGMTMYVGSTPGAMDLGRVRVRSIDGGASEITVAENDHIQWADDAYLKIVRFWEPWAVYPRIVLTDDNIPIFYKDYDIPYTDQNQYFDPVVHLGPHTAAFLEDGVAQIFYSSSGTVDPTDGSTPTGIAWWFEGATTTGSFDSHPGLITYDTPGHYTTHLTVVSNYGKQFTGHRHVMIFDKPGQGDHPPIIGWGFMGLEGSRSAGGYSGRFWLREEADFNKVVPGALVVIFSEDWYGDEKVSIGGNAVGRSNIFFVGYVEDESIEYNSYTSRLEFRVSSLTLIADQKHTFSASLESVGTPTTWYEIADMTVDKAIIHFLRWHTTLLTIADFEMTGDSKHVQYIDFSRGTIFSEVDDLLESTLGADLVADRQGKLWAEINANYTATGSRTPDKYPENMELERCDWIGQIEFDRLVMDRVSFLEHGGVSYSGPATGTFEPHLSGAPGDAPSYEGSVQRRTGLVLEGQDQLNEFTGLMFAALNSKYPRLTVTLAGDYRNIDIAPQEFILLSLDENDTYRRIIWDKKRFLPVSINYQYDARRQFLLQSLILAEETHGPPGETIEIPVDPPYEPYDLPEWELPPLELPPINFPPVISPPPGEGSLVYVCFDHVIARTRNFWDDDPDWETVALASDFPFPDFWGMVLDPANPQGTALVWGGAYIYRTDDLDSANPTWTQVFSNALYPTYDINGIGHVKPWIMGRLWSVAAVRNGGTPGNCPIDSAPCLTHLRAGPSATGWQGFQSGMDVGNIAYPAMIQPATYANGVAYIVGNGYVLYSSIDTGTSWTKRWQRPTGNIGAMIPQPMAHLGNSAGNYIVVAAAGRGAGDPDRMLISSDYGVTWSVYGPTYKGKAYLPIIGSATGYGNLNETYWVHPKTGVGYGMLGPDGSGPFIFAKRTTAWVVLREFVADITPYTLNFSDNGEHHYAMGTASDARILGSEDGGETWLDKEGDFSSAVMDWSAVGSRASICPVWTV